MIPESVPIDSRRQYPARSLHIGITGGIACGKSHVSQFFARLGGLVLDADQVARQVVRPGYPAYREIVDHFGSGVLTLSGELNRQHLASIVFTDPVERQTLNAIVHPRVEAEMDTWLADNESLYPITPLFIEAALIVETCYYKKLDYLVVVHCNQELQRRRIIKRDLISREQAEQRIFSQMPWEEKMKAADFLIDTSGPYRHTLAQTVDIFMRFMEI